MNVELTNFELFKSFAEFEQGGIHIDLHNEFDCKAIDFSNKQKRLILSFEPNEYCKRKVSSIEVIFDDCRIEHYYTKLNKVDVDSGILDIMYRGRFETNYEQLSEASDGSQYYYINFLPEMCIELFSKSVRAKVNLTPN
jgi:hypothetical protein